MGLGMPINCQYCTFLSYRPWQALQTLEYAYSYLQLYCS